MTIANNIIAIITVWSSRTHNELRELQQLLGVIFHISAENTETSGGTELVDIHDVPKNTLTGGSSQAILY